MKNNSRNRLKDYLQLSKLTIMLPVSLTGFTGYFIFKPEFSAPIFFVTTGILLMAMSASILNQIQEADLDKKMKRTINRPIPAGRIDSRYALLFSIFTMIPGFFIIYWYSNVQASIVGLFTICWYNGLYTPLKKKTAFAVVPGALTGVLPTLIGWLAAGGSFFDKPIVYIEFLFFMGQVPHFWLIIIKYGKEYNEAGIPSLTNIFTTNQINRLTFTWVLTSVSAALFLCYLEIIRNSLMILLLLIASIFLVWKFSALLKTFPSVVSYNTYSKLLNMYFMFVLVLLIIDNLPR